MSLADLSFAPTSRFYRHIFIFLSSLTIKNTVCMPTAQGYIIEHGSSKLFHCVAPGVLARQRLRPDSGLGPRASITTYSVSAASRGRRHVPRSAAAAAVSAPLPAGPSPSDEAY